MDKITLTLESQRCFKIVSDRMEKLLGKENFSTVPIADARKIFRQLLAPVEELQPIKMDVGDTFVSYDTAKIPLRVYNPGSQNQLLPALVFFHGGGFLLGDLDFIDYSCRLLAQAIQCVVISVEYRKAPEHKFPTAHEDSYQALKYVHAHAKEFGSNGIIAVGGESAGGNLAASMCHMAKQRKDVSIKAQVLYYPWVNLNNNFPSNEKFATGYLLETPGLEWMREQFLSNDEERNDPIANPLLQKDFTNLPPALILAAELDPIRDENKSYFDKLNEAKVDAHFVEFGGIFHGFFALPWFFQESYSSYLLVGEFLKRHLT